MTDWDNSHLQIVAKMLSSKVAGKHHKQTDTIKNWVNLDGDLFESALDDLCKAPEAPVRKKARQTVHLTSIHEAKEFLREHDDDDEFVWHL